MLFFKILISTIDNTFNSGKVKIAREKMGRVKLWLNLSKILEEE